jgi:hypothetical protein
MPQELGNGINIRSQGELQGGEGMPGTVKSDVFVNAGFSHPLLKDLIVPGGIFQFLENKCFSRLPGAQLLKSDRRQGKRFFSLCLVLPETDKGSVLTVFMDVFPAKVSDISIPESGKCAEKESSLKGFIPAGRLAKYL